MRLAVPGLVFVLAACTPAGGTPSADVAEDSGVRGEAGCGTDPLGRGPMHCPDSQLVPRDSPPPDRPGADLHTVEIEQRYEAGSDGAVYIEGARTEVLVTGADGVEQALHGDESARLTVSLPAGRYVVQPALRPCSGHCAQHLGARTDGCALTIDVPTTQRLRVRHVVGQPCTVEAG